MIDNDVTQPPRLAKTNHARHTSTASMADHLQEVVDALRALGDVQLCPTWLKVVFQVSQGAPHRDRCAAVDRLAAAFGQATALCPDIWHYETSVLYDDLKVYTPAVTDADYREARQAGLAKPEPAFTPGEPFDPGTGPLPGYVAGFCGHRVAESEWRAGFITCERCPAGAREADQPEFTEAELAPVSPAAADGEQLVREAAQAVPEADGESAGVPR